jgi:N-acetylmuramate 1-kinase
MSNSSNSFNNRINKFLLENQLANCLIEPIKQDASSRKYYRIQNNKNILLMDSISLENKNHEFIKVSKYLKKIGLSSPEIVVTDHKNGLFLIEDFGDLTFNKAIKNNINEELLYTNAVECLSQIHSRTPPIYIPKYSQQYLINEVNLFTEWYPKEFNIQLNTKSQQEWEVAWNEAFKNLSNNKLVLRDFHADNLFWLPKRKKSERVGLIDFQDALIGNKAYDISSLLEDVRRDVSEETKNICIKKFINLNKIKNKKKFIKDYFILTAQRNAKIVGIFIRLARRDKKISYLKLVNKAMRIFINSAKKADLKEILRWVHNNIPNDKINFSDFR